MNTKKIFKYLFYAIVIIFIIAFMIYFLPYIRKISTHENMLKFKEFLDKKWFIGFILLTFLQILQIVIPIIPGGPLEILAGLCLGSIWGTIFIIVTSFISTYLILYIVKKFGIKFVYKIFKKKEVDKFLHSKMFENPKKIEIAMLILFLIPGMPKDLLTYIGGLLSINKKNFLLIATFGRIPAVVAATITGSNVIGGKWSLIAVVYIITILIILGIIYYVSKNDDNKTLNKIFKSIR